MKTMLLVLVALLVGFSPIEVQTTPTCQLGTAWAVNPGRQLAPGEKILTVQGGPQMIVTTTQRETPGSSHIVHRRCSLPLGPHEVVIGGILPWMKICGQDFVPEGWIVPGMVLQGPMGPQGPQGLMGPTGPQGQQGPAGENFTVPPPKSGCGTWCKVGIGAAIIGGVVAVGEHNNWWRGHPGPEIATDGSTVTCTGDPCPGAPTVGGNKWGGIRFALPIR